MGFRQLISKAGDIAQQVNQEYQRSRDAQKQFQPQQQQYGQPGQYGQQQPQQQYGQSSQYGQPGQYAQTQQSDQARYQPSSPAWSPPPTAQQYGQSQQQYQNVYNQHGYQRTQDPIQLAAEQQLHAATAYLAAQEAEAAQYQTQLNQLSRDADAELARQQERLQRGQQDADAELARQQERLQREQQEALREKERVDAQLAAGLREAERLQRVYQGEYEREIKAAEGEGERLRREGEEQMKREEEEQMRRFEALKIREDAPPTMPPRPVSQVYHPPPPPRPTSSVPPLSVQVSPPAATGGQGNVYYPPPPRSPQLPPRPTSSVMSGYTAPSVQVSPPSAQSVYYQPPPPSLGVKTGATSTGEVYRQPSPQSTPTFDPPPREAQNISYQQPSHQSSPVFAPPPTQPQPSPYQPNPPKQQPYTEPPSIPRHRTPPPQKPHPCGIIPLAECIEDPVSFSVDWFHHAAAPEFPICSKCYVDKIYDTQFKDAFKLANYTERKPRKCLFGTKRIQDIFWPAVLALGSLSDMMEFMQKRQNIKHCPEENPTEGQSWYMTPDIPNSTFCQACYEDGLAASPFASKFHLVTPQGASFCDSSAVYVKKMFQEHAPTNNWSAFIEGVKLRIHCLPCPKREVIKATERIWYSSSRKPLDLQICQACYYDFIHGTADETIFPQRAPKEERATCLLAVLNLRVPANVAIAKKDRGIFWTGINGVDDNVYCSTNGTKGASWYTLPNDPVGFGVCGGCFAGVVQSMGGTGYFVPKSVAPTDELLCCFNASHIRFLGFFFAYMESLLKGDPKYLAEFASVFSNVPFCPRDRVRVGTDRKWWGWDTARICEDCYLTFAKDTALESQFYNRGVFDAAWHPCDLFSPRMRTLYNEACSTGDLLSFLTFAKQRQVIYRQTKFAAQQMVDQQKIRASQARMAGMQGSFYKNLGWKQDAMMGHSYTVGNARVGYGHANEWVAQGVAFDQKASSLAAGVGGDVGVVRELERSWAEVA